MINLPPNLLLGTNSPALQQALSGTSGAELGQLVAELEHLQGGSSFNGLPPGAGVQLGSSAFQGSNAGPLSGVAVGAPPSFASLSGGATGSGAAYGGIPYGSNSVYGFGNSLSNGYPGANGVGSSIGLNFGGNNFNMKTPSLSSSGSTGSSGFSTSFGNSSFANFSFGNIGTGGTGATGATGSGGAKGAGGSTEC